MSTKKNCDKIQYEKEKRQIILYYTILYYTILYYTILYQYYRMIPATIAHKVAQAILLLGYDREEVSPNSETELHDDYVQGDDDSDTNEYTVVNDDGIDLNLWVKFLIRFIFFTVL